MSEAVVTGYVMAIGADGEAGLMLVEGARFVAVPTSEVARFRRRTTTAPYMPAYLPTLHGYLDGQPFEQDVQTARDAVHGECCTGAYLSVYMWHQGVWWHWSTGRGGVFLKVVWHPNHRRLDVLDRAC